MPQPQISEPDFIEHVELVAELFRFADLREELDRFADRHLEDVVDRFSEDLHAQDVRLETAAFAFGATHIEIAQELHLDLLEAGAATALATAAAGVERERARGQSLRHRFRLGGEQFADAIVKPEIKNRRRARGARKLRLIDHHHFADPVRARDRFARAGLLVARLPFRLEQVPIKDVVDQSGFAGTRNAGDAVENSERNFDVEILEVVLSRAGDPDRAG